jgi:predicted ribosomally synthesized peptide with SipW-like signal peptide
MGRHAAPPFLATGRAGRAATTSRRVRALLAGGLVLGIGGAVTLAAWNDSEYTSGSFAAGVFGIQGSADGATYTDHPVGSPAPLTFAPTVGAMIPGTVSYSLFSIKTITNSIAGTVQIGADAANVAPGTLGTYLQYDIRTIAGTSCTAATFASGTSILAAATLATSPGTAQNIAANGAVVNYCFKFTLPASADNGAQGKTLTAKWTFTATNS